MIAGKRIEVNKGLLLLFGIVLFVVSCDDTGDDEGYFFEDEEEYYEEEPAEVVQNHDEIAEYAPTIDSTPLNGDLPFDPDTVKDYGPEEYKASSVKDLINQNLTNGKVDSNKVRSKVLSALMASAKTPLGIAFTCGQYGFFGSDILIPIEQNESFSSIYLPTMLGDKKVHFMVLNFRGYVSAKKYTLSCDRNDPAYKEIFVFYPHSETRTQASLVFAINDEYLKETETLININWRTGEEDAEHKDYGVVQFLLKKDLKPTS